jgi:selenocysteine lyase/cysteine desulfurase
MYDLEQLRREEFPLSQNLLYFAHASVSPLPTRTRQAMQDALECFAEDPLGYWVKEGDALVHDRLKQEVAVMVNAQPSEVVSVFNTGAGINLIAQSLPIQPGDNIIFCDLEFPANVYPWMSLERDGVEIRMVPAQNGGLTLQGLERYVDSRTRVVAASAIQFFTGHRTDLAGIGAFCRQRGILFVVDAIQAVGHIPLDMKAMYMDILVTGGQKSLMAPHGTGFMVVRDEVAEKLNPRFISATSTRDWTFWIDYDITPLDGADRFKASTPNVIGIFGMMESLRLLQELGLENIDQHTQGLVRQTIALMEGLGYQTVTDLSAHGPIATFRLDMTVEQSDALVNYLGEQRIKVIRHLSRERIPHLRLSFHCYNTSEEVEQFAAIIRDFNL